MSSGPNSGGGFESLTPDAVLGYVEAALGVRCGAFCRPLASYINRVYEVGLSDGSPVIAKFYRPGRWSRAALEDELVFLEELHRDEVPVVPPRPGADGALLHAAGNGWLALFPKKGGRTLEEPSRQDWPQIGRLIARMHTVGARHPAADRIILHPAQSSAGHLERLLASGRIDPSVRGAYEKAARSVLALVTPLFEGATRIRIHGDCHRMNILHRPGEGFHLIDFDDMAMGPAVQDLWMLLPGRWEDARMEADLLAEGYETFQPFPWAEVKLIEPLRAMRFIHYAAWCAAQAADGGLHRLMPGWGGPDYWRQETENMETQRREILDAWEG
jgi:Ser/Thr protein kinase RdoA (MazF antagonist)